MENKSAVPHSNEQLLMFRKKAEALVNQSNTDAGVKLGTMEMEELMHELQVFQIELEMQNDELRISHSNLQLEKTKFSGLYDLAPVGYFILNKFGAVEEINITGLTLMETVKSEIIGRRFQNYVFKDHSDEFYNLLRKMRAYKARHTCQLKIVSNKGKIFYAQLEGAGIINTLTTELQFYVAVIDITSRRQAEQRLIESNERLKMTLEASAMGTWEIDLKKQHIYFDENSYSILEFENWEFDGKYESFFKLLHPEDREAFKNQLLFTVKEEKDLDTEIRLLLPFAGLRFIAIRGHIVHQDPDIARFVGVIIDITEKKRLQHEADELRHNYQKSIVAAGLQAQEKERKRISDALHDSVAQMLYSIRLSLQNSGTNLLDDKISNINQLLNQAISEIRNISFELAPSLLTDFGLTDSVKEMAKRLTTENLSIVVKVPGPNLRFKSEIELSAFRIIQELVNNSIKHSSPTQVIIKINTMNQCISISVNDNGCGFNLKASNYLTKGSGLLSIKNRISLFNGNFDIKSVKGKGTTVNVTLKAEAI